MKLKKIEGVTTFEFDLPRLRLRCLVNELSGLLDVEGVESVTLRVTDETIVLIPHHVSIEIAREAS